MSRWELDQKFRALLRKLSESQRRMHALKRMWTSAKLHQMEAAP